MHREAFRLRFCHLGPAATGTLSSMRNIAEALGFQEKWVDYDMLSVELAKLSRAWLGLTHMATLSSYKALSICYCRRGWLKLAEKLARDVVDGRKRAQGLGETHPSTLKSISHLALILGHNGKWKEAEQQELHVSTLLGRILGPKHPDTLTSQCNLASIRTHLDMETAQKMFQEIYNARRDLLGPDHPDTKKSKNYISRPYRDQGLPEITRFGCSGPPDPKRLVWTGGWREGNRLCSVSELETRPPESLLPIRNVSTDTATTADDEETATMKWSQVGSRISRTDFMPSYRSEHSTTYWSLDSISKTLQDIDAEEKWVWLKTNAPGHRPLSTILEMPDLLREATYTRESREPPDEDTTRSHAIYRTVLESARNSRSRKSGDSQISEDANSDV